MTARTGLSPEAVRELCIVGLIFVNTVDYHGVPGRYYHVARERTLDMALSHTRCEGSVRKSERKNLDETADESTGAARGASGRQGGARATRGAGENGRAHRGEEAAARWTHEMERRQNERRREVSRDKTKQPQARHAQDGGHGYFHVLTTGAR